MQKNELAVGGLSEKYYVLAIQSLFLSPSSSPPVPVLMVSSPFLSPLLTHQILSLPFLSFSAFPHITSARFRPHMLAACYPS